MARLDMLQSSATIKLFLPHGDAKRLRIGEISNWTGKALAAPRTDLEELLARDELLSSAIYFLFGFDENSGEPMAYIGEAEVARDRLKQQRSKDFWVSVAVFVSKDENLTKAHIRYLESRLIEESKANNRYRLENVTLNSPKLPESDREDMEVFLARVRQLLPVLGSDLLTPIAGSPFPPPTTPTVSTKIKGAIAKGRRTETGFVVFAGSRAVLNERPSAAQYHAPNLALRRKLIETGALVENEGFYLFTRDTEFSGPSAAVTLIHGGGGLGRMGWKDDKGRTLKEIEET